jgi:[ribosomal protein S5]-alanine N-acetyltransferase
LLKPFQTSDVSEVYLGWLNDKNLMQFSRQRRLRHTAETAMDYIRGFENSSNFLWSVHVQDDDLHVGNISAIVDEYNLVADIGILIGHNNWRGRGTGKFSFGAAIAYLLSHGGMHKVTAGTLSVNTAMIKIMQYWEMQLEGVFREHELLDSGRVDVHRYALLSSEWSPSRYHIVLPDG